jgi:hypothetical protein
MKEKQLEEEVLDEKRNKKYIDLFHKKSSRYLDDMLTTQKE